MTSPMSGESTLAPWRNLSVSATWSSPPGKTLREVNQEKALTLLPACIFLACLALFGLVGNSLVCYVFGARLKPGTQNSLIVCLAVFDLLSCALGIPNEIADMQFYFTYSSEAACKIMRFINMFTSLGSIFTLLFIAIDRYRKVCLPFKSQLHMCHIKKFVVPVIMGGALFFAWPSLLVYGLRSAETGVPGLTGCDCSASEALKGTVVPLVYNSVLCGGFLVIVVALACLYFKVLRGVRRLNRNKLLRRRRSAPGGGADSGFSLTSTPRRAREAMKMEMDGKVVDDQADPHAEAEENCKNQYQEQFGEVRRKSNCASDDCCKVNSSHTSYTRWHEKQYCISNKPSLDESIHYEVQRRLKNSTNCKHLVNVSSISLSHVKARRTFSLCETKLCKYRRKCLKRHLSFPLTYDSCRFVKMNNCGLIFHPQPNPYAHIPILDEDLPSKAHLSESCPIFKSFNTQAPLTPEKTQTLKCRAKGDRVSFLLNRTIHNHTCRRRTAPGIMKNHAVSTVKSNGISASMTGQQGQFSGEKEQRPPGHIHFLPSATACDKKYNVDLNKMSFQLANLLSLQSLESLQRRDQLVGLGSNLFQQLQVHPHRNSTNIHSCRRRLTADGSMMRKGKVLRFDINKTDTLRTQPHDKKTNGTAATSRRLQAADSCSNTLKLIDTKAGEACEDTNTVAHNDAAQDMDTDKAANKPCYDEINVSFYRASRSKTFPEEKQHCPERDTPRARRPLTLARRGKMLSVLCPPSSSTVLQTSAKSSFASAMTSSSTIDSHYSRFSSSSPHEDRSPLQTSSTSSSTNAAGFHRHRPQDSRRLRGQGHRLPRSRTTTIALLVTLIFVASFLPHLCLQAAQLTSDAFDANLTGPASLAYNAFLRSYFINSAANPVLYGILNLKFSAEVKALLGRGGS